MQEKLRLAAVGLGRLGRYHAETIAHRLPGVTLKAVCSVDQGEIDELARALDFEESHLSYESLLQSEIDGVVLSTPSALHCRQIEQALERGWHVFCEKPLGIELEECERTAEVVRRHPDQVFMLGFMRRYDPSYQYACEMIRTGEIGRPILFRGYSVDPVQSIEGALRYAPHSAGQFLDMAVHDIDLARWMLGAEPVSVYAVGGCFAYPEFAKYGDGDNVSALLQFEKEAMAFLFAGRTAPHGYNVETEIVGTKRTLRIASVPQQNFVEILDEQGVRKVCSQDFIERFGSAYVNELQEFVNCIREQRQPTVTVTDGVEATRIALAATRSFREKKLWIL